MREIKKTLSKEQETEALVHHRGFRTVWSHESPGKVWTKVMFLSGGIFSFEKATKKMT